MPTGRYPYKKSSQGEISIQTPSGVYKCTYILQGSTDTGNHFQGLSSLAFNDIAANVLDWLGDFVIRAACGKEPLTAVQNVFRICIQKGLKVLKFIGICLQKGLKVQSKKMDLFCKMLSFCSRTLHSEGRDFDRLQLKSLYDMQKPGRLRSCSSSPAPRSR